VTVWGLAASLALPAATRPGSDDDARWVARRVAAIKETRENWRQIPWVRSVAVARRLGREEGRPVFLFTHDGNLDTGRC
jgi:hypothetical protein